MFEAQCENPSNSSLNNKADWLLISDTLIAEGGESFILIGNFRDTIATEYYKLSDGALWSNGTMILVDNVSLVELKDVGTQDENGLFTISVTPNPVTDVLHVRVPGNLRCPYSIFLKGALGEEVFSRLNIFEKELSISFAKLPKGIYYLSITNHQTHLTQQVLKMF